MSEIIKFHALDLSGETTLKLFLRTDDGSLLNAGGDALAEISSSGVFEATLAESRTGLGSLAVRVCDGTETADNLLYDDFLPESSTVIGAKRDAVLDSATRVKLASEQPDYAPLKAPALRGDLTLAEAVDLILAGVLGVSAQPSGSEELFKFVDAVNAFTTTFDTAGNRTAVVIH